MLNTKPAQPRIFLPRFSLRKIAYFVVAADTGNMSAAARQLSISPGALYDALGDLEKDIGADLFVRYKARGVTLTSVGQQLLSEARGLVRHAETFESFARGPRRELSGEIVIGCFPTLLPFVGPQLLADFHDSYPAVTLRFVENSQPALEEAMLAGSIDVSILYDVDIVSALERRTLFEAVPYVLLSKDHRLAIPHTPVDLAELAGEAFIQMDLMPGKNDYFFSCAGITPRPAHRTTNFELVRSLVARNLGYAVLLQRPASNITYEGLPVEIRPIANKVPPLKVIFAWPSHIHLHRRVEELMVHGERLFRRACKGNS